MKTTKDEVTVTILVDQPSAEDVTAKVTVPFKVFKEDQQFRAVPLLDEKERKRARLPEVISFAFVEHCIVTKRSLHEDTIEIIKNMIQELMVQEMIF